MFKWIKKLFDHYNKWVAEGNVPEEAVIVGWLSKKSVTIRCPKGHELRVPTTKIDKWVTTDPAGCMPSIYFASYACEKCGGERYDIKSTDAKTLARREK